MELFDLPEGFQNMLSFGFMDALMGRRSRRFFRGAEIPDGIFAYKFRYDPLPLPELEKLLVVAEVGGNTGWNNLIYLGEPAGDSVGFPASASVRCVDGLPDRLKKPERFFRSTAWPIHASEP